MKRILSLFVVLVFVAGCGGGSDDTSSIMDPEIMEPMEPEVVEPETEKPEIPDTPLYSECPNPIDLQNFLHETLNGELTEHFKTSTQFTEGEDIINRFNDRPELSLAEGTTDYQENIVRKAVGIINSALPDEYKIRIRSEYVQARSKEPPWSEIYVDFAPKAEWDVSTGYGTGTLGRTENYYFINYASPTSSERASHVWIDSEDVASFSEDRLLYLVSHELFHALGVKRHILPTTSINFSHSFYSIMWSKIPAEGSRIYIGSRRGASVSFKFRDFEFSEGILNPVDWWGLKYLYEEFETGDEPVFEFGPDDLVSPQVEEWLMEKEC